MRIGRLQVTRARIRPKWGFGSLGGGKFSHWCFHFGPWLIWWLRKGVEFES
jgi:hypothetical protein